ncbi:alpha/beta-hydrolase [Hyaloscypha variabilis]
MTSLPELQIFSLENNVKLAYRSLPTKPNPELPTIVFFHPLLTDSSFFHRQFIDPKLGGEAGRKWNLIAIDLHGHGDTTGRDTFTFSDTSRDSLALLDHFKISEVIAFGVSQGVLASLNLAILRPELVKGVVIVGSSILPQTPENLANLQRLTAGFPYDKQSTKAALFINWGAEYEHVLEHGAGPEGMSRTDWEQVWIDRYGGSKAKEERFHKALDLVLKLEDLEGDLHKIKARILMLHGSSDILLTVEAHAIPTKAIIEKAGIFDDLVVIEGGSHFLSWGKWQEVDTRLVAFEEKIFGA